MVVGVFYEGNSRRLKRKYFYVEAGNHPATPGLQDMCLSPTHFCGFPGYKLGPLGWFKI